MDQRRLHDLASDRQHGVQCRCRVLEDEPDILATHPAQLGRICLVHARAAQHDAAADHRTRRQQSHTAPAP